jgi:alpha-beta hydrolase superfamily lysophospholipase
MPSLITHDGLNLHRRDWTIAPPARGHVLICHGLGEHMERYAELAGQLNAAGWQVHGWDHRGHGQSLGQRGNITHADDLLRDTGTMIDAIRGGIGGEGTLVLLGHSMGGAVAARFVAEGLAPQPAAWWRPVDALVLSSPALDPGLNAGQKLALAAALPLAPSLAVNNGLKPAWISRDPAVVKAYVADPLVHDRITARLTRFILDAGQAAVAAAPRWTVPTLLTWAGADRCVRPAGSEAFAAAASASVVTAKPWPGLFHEIFNEPEKAQVVAKLIAWLGQR